MASSDRLEIEAPPVWTPSPATHVQFPGFRVSHGGPQAMCLPEHEHREIQVQSRFLFATDSRGLTAAHSCLYAPGQAHRGGWEEGWQVIVLLLEAMLLQRTADELFAGDGFEIRPFSNAHAPLIEQLNHAVLRELRRPHGPERFYLESVGHVIAGHLLREHADTRAASAIKGRFSAAQMRRIEHYVEERVGADLAVADLAAVVRLGAQRFTERFRRTTGSSPWQYVQAMRITRARQLLAQAEISLAEIAHSLGYSSQSHFTTVFRQATGVTPGAYRKGL